MPDPWNLNLTCAMRRALFVLNESGKLYRWAGTFGIAPLGEQFQEITILALIERGLVAMRKPHTDYHSHFAVLTAVGRLFAVQQKRFGGLRYKYDNH